MKELSIEQKAKAYDEAVINGSRLWECGEITRENYEYIFPELKVESEDERIRKALIRFHKSTIDIDGIKGADVIAWLEKQANHADFCNKIQIGDKVTRNRDGVLVNLSQLNRVAKPAERQGEISMGISEATKQELEDNLNKALEKETPESWNEFLEKQDEQNPAWSEEDERMIECVFDSLNTYAHKGHPCLKSVVEDEISWLKSIKDRVLPQSKQKWSEQEQVRINRIVACLENLNVADNDILLKDVDWLKSLKPQSTWKPSNEQMLAIDTAISVIGKGTLNGKCLIELYEQLKKLRRE